MRRINLRVAFIFERGGLDFANDADDFARKVFIAPDRDPFSDRRGLGAEVFDRSLPVYDHDLYRAFVVPFAESPTS